MRTTKKWLAAMAVAALTIGLTGFAASTAGATEEVDDHEGLCLIDPGQAEEGYWTEEIPEVSHEGPAPWWNWSPNDTQGPQDYEPAWPDDDRGTWEGQPHGNGGPEQDTFGTFNASNADVGNSPWFHREHGEIIIDQEYVAPEWVITQEYIPETWGPCGVSPDPALFNAEPDPATCFAAGSFDYAGLGGTPDGQSADWRDYDFENFYLWVYIGTPGEVTLYLWADPNFTFEGLSDAWTLYDGGTSAIRTITLEDQLVGPDCQVAPPQPEPLSGEGVAAVSQCVVPANGTATLVTTTTPWTQEYVWVEDVEAVDGGTWVLGDKVYGTPVPVTTTVADAGCAAKAPPTTAVPGNPSFTG